MILMPYTKHEHLQVMDKTAGYYYNGNKGEMRCKETGNIEKRGDISRKISGF